MPNIDSLIDTIQQNLNANASHETGYFSILDWKQAHSQLKCHFQHHKEKVANATENTHLIHTWNQLLLELD